MTRQKCSLFFTLLFFSLFFINCDKGKNIPDVSDISIDLDFRHFEKDLFSLDTNNIAKSYADLMNKYPVFGDIYFNQILKINDPRYAPQGYEAYLKGFIGHPAVEKLYDTVQVLYSDPNRVKSHFSEAFKFYKHYYPQEKTPTVTTFLSEYSVAAFIYGENDLAVGLDFFLGDKYPYQNYNPGNDAFSSYLTRTFNEEHLVSKAIRTIAEDKAGRIKGDKLLDFMIHNGKQLYFSEQILPHTPDSILMELSSEKMAWAQDNEREIYAYLLDRELLFSTDYREFNKLINPSPVGNSDMPQDAPGQTANYIGWQIVRTYMARNPETTLASLMQIADAQEILDGSRYKPVRK